jgi:hypothetical protein
MPDNLDGRRGGSLGFGLILIALGVFFLVLKLWPGIDPWPFLAHYWPLLLIGLGIAKLIDVVMARNNPGRGGFLPGVAVLVLVLIVFLALAAHSGGRGHTFGDDTLEHTTKQVEKGNATSVVASLDMPAGELDLTGGSAHLLDADFRYTHNQGTPEVDYNVSGSSGRLDLSQHGGGVHIGNDENDWDVRLSNDVPMELDLKMGAGEGTLHLQGLQLTRLDVHMGAGELNLDLTGDRKQDLEATVHGGVGEATIRLPRNVGVQVRASGGIGSIDATGLHQNGDEYTNDAYGKSPVTIHMTVEGGVGQINLIEEQ